MLTIYVDADACPVKEEVYRVARRYGMRVAVVANAPLRAKSMDNPKADEAEWVVLLEGSDAATVGAAARQSFKLAALRPFGVREAPVIASYRLLFGAPG